jgi:type VI secretion system protein ImpF
VADPEAPAARALLFERLWERAPGAPPDSSHGRVHDRAALRASVAREVVRLLNTRVPAASTHPAGRTVLDYGLADWSPTHTLDPAARTRLEADARSSIEAFEPRLRKVKVSAETVTGRERTLLIRVDALLVVEGGEEPVSFPVVVGDEGGSA